MLYATYTKEVLSKKTPKKTSSLHILIEISVDNKLSKYHFSVSVFNSMILQYIL